MHAPAPSIAQLNCSRVGFAYGPRRILHDITLTVAPGDRIGIVGPNGTGKTTLLRLMAGQLAPAEGTVTTRPVAARVGLLSQQLDDRPGESIVDFIGRTTGIADVVAEFDRSVTALADGRPGSDERYDQALARYLAVDAATLDERSERTLALVGAGEIGGQRPTRALSGGQRTRVNLAAMLLASFDVLLLDEPTNDLDASGLDLLEDMLLTQERAIVVVSHDRAFLERVTTAIFELDDHAHTGTRFNGGFAAWEHAREVARQQHYDAYAEYNEKRSQLQSRAQKQRQWSAAGVRRAKTDTSEKDKNIKAFRIATSEKVASKAKQTERALERFERNESVEAPWEPWELRLEFLPAARSGTEVAVLHGATVERGGFTLGPIDLLLTEGDRVMITGENGSGKTTLLQALLGEIELDGGTRHIGPSVHVARLHQARRLFDEASSLLRGFADASGLDDQRARSQLAKLGLDTERIDRPAHALSPGERTRAALGLFAARGSNLLVLDEPTNHLDLPAIEQLEAALDVFPHTLLLVTHDRRLIENVTTNRHWHLDDGGLVEI